MLQFICFFFLVTTLTWVVDSFAPASLSSTTTTTTTTTQLWMSSSSSPSSRRDVLKNTGSAAAVATATSWLINPGVAEAGNPITAQSAANKANESYQGVYYDPRHPDGYRVLMKMKGKTIMTLSDDGAAKSLSGEEPKTYREIPVTVNDDNDDLTFDFSFKGGPKNIKGKLSSDKQSITFDDGNVWTKNYYKYDGVYKVTKIGKSGGEVSEDAYRVITRNRPEIRIEMNDTGNPKDSYYVVGDIGSLFSIPTSSITFYFGGKSKDTYVDPGMDIFGALEDWQRGDGKTTTSKDDMSGTVTAQLQYSQDWNTVFPYGTITFPDKTVWTRQ